MVNFKKIYFHLLLAIIFLPIAGSQKQVLPRFDAPVGVINEHHCCYIIQWLQLMNAVYHAIPDVFQKLLADSRYSLLGAYAKTLNNVFGNSGSYRGFAAQRFVLDPDVFVQAFVEKSSKRGSMSVFEERRLADGTTQKMNRAPWKKEAGYGYTSEVMQLFLEQWSVACKEHRVINPFESLIVTLDDSIISCNWISLAELCRASSTNKFDVAVVDTSCLLTSQAHIMQYPHVLITVNSDETKDFVFPKALQVNTNNNDGTVITYKLLAVTYAFPVFSADKGFVGSHVITIARYGPIWYLCDDDSIMPFMNEQAAYNWIAKAHEFTYSGPGLPQHACRVIMPHIVMYIRDCST